MDWLYLVTVAGISYWYMRRTKRASSSDAGLVGGEKFIVPLLVLLNPVVNGAVFYFGWKKSLPKKATSANHWSLGIFLIYLVGVGFFFWQSDADQIREANRSVNQAVANTEAEVVLTGVRTEAVSYYGENDSYAGMCDQLSSMDVTLPGSSIDAKSVLSAAECVAQTDSFAVSVSGSTKNYCISGGSERIIPSGVKEGYTVEQGSTSCAEATSTPQANTATSKEDDDDYFQQ